MMRPRAFQWAAAVASANLLFLAGAAEASFPGRSGEILFGLSRETEDGMQETCRNPSCGFTKLFAIHPGTRSVRRVPSCAGTCDDLRPAVGPQGARIVFERKLYFRAWEL
jgi:hypothetical protein